MFRGAEVRSSHNYPIMHSSSVPLDYLGQAEKVHTIGPHSYEAGPGWQNYQSVMTTSTLRSVSSGAASAMSSSVSSSMTDMTLDDVDELSFISSSGRQSQSWRREPDYDGDKTPVKEPSIPDIASALSEETLRRAFDLKQSGAEGGQREAAIIEPKARGPLFNFPGVPVRTRSPDPAAEQLAPPQPLVVPGGSRCPHCKIHCWLPHSPNCPNNSSGATVYKRSASASAASSFRRKHQS